MDMISVHMKEKIWRTPSSYDKDSGGDKSMRCLCKRRHLPLALHHHLSSKHLALPFIQSTKLFRKYSGEKPLKPFKIMFWFFLHFWEKITSQIHRLRNFQISHLLVLLSPEQTRYLAGKLEIPASTLHSLHLRILSRKHGKIFWSTFLNFLYY